MKIEISNPARGVLVLGNRLLVLNYIHIIYGNIYQSLAILAMCSIFYERSCRNYKSDFKKKLPYTGHVMNLTPHYSVWVSGYPG